MTYFIRLFVLLALAAGSTAFPSWYNCSPANCQAEKGCTCASLSAPGGLSPADTPQIITITHDDAVNPLSNKVVKAVIDKHTNPNGTFSSLYPQGIGDGGSFSIPIPISIARGGGASTCSPRTTSPTLSPRARMPVPTAPPAGCNVPATWFTLQSGSDCATVKKLYDENSEIAIHTSNHLRLDPNFAGGPDAMEEEMFGVRKWLNTGCGIPLEDLCGFRAPYLISNQKTRALLQKEGMCYDSSMISAFSQGSDVSTVPGQRPFPFTMDMGIPIDAQWNYPDGQCNCSTESYPGLFELPMYELQNAAGEHLASMDPEGDVFNIYRENFDMNYQNNRAPFGVYLHAPWFDDKNTAALNQFMEYAMAKPDVWVLTMRQLAEWMQNPVPASKMGEWLTCKNVTLTPAVGTVRCQQYTVKAGDSAYNIATAFAVTTEDFILANANNPSFGQGENMKPGDSVLIPPWDDGCVGKAVRPVTGPGQVLPSDGFPTEKSQSDDPCKTHVAAPQDMWATIAEIYRVSENDLRNANTDVLGNVSSGIKLRIPPYKDSCPEFVNDPRPSVLGPSQGVTDQNGPPSGFRINMILSGRTKIDYEFDLAAPFKLTVSQALNTAPSNVRFAQITEVGAATAGPAGSSNRRALLQTPEVNLEMTIPDATPLSMYANVSRDLGMDSQFAKKDLATFRVAMMSPPVIRIIESSTTYDVDPNPSPVGSSASSGSTSSGSTSSGSTSSSGLSTGAIVGIAVGAAVGLILLVVAVVIVRKRRATGTNTGDHVGDDDVATPSSTQSSPKGKSIGSDVDA